MRLGPWFLCFHFGQQNVGPPICACIVYATLCTISSHFRQRLATVFPSYRLGCHPWLHKHIEGRRSLLLWNDYPLPVRFGTSDPFLNRLPSPSPLFYVRPFIVFGCPCPCFVPSHTDRSKLNRNCVIHCSLGGPPRRPSSHCLTRPRFTPSQNLRPGSFDLT